MLRLVVGEIAEVFAYSSSRRPGWLSEDSAVVTCRVHSGIISQQLYRWACPTPQPGPELTLYGSVGSMEVYISYRGPGGGAVLCMRDRAEEWFATGSNYFDSLAGVLIDWATACRNNKSPVASGEEGLRDMAVMTAIRESIQTRRSVAVKDVPSGRADKR